jgi:DNA-binding NarL/FixJ family response regulator
MGTPRVILADDDVLLREGLASLLERSDFRVVAQAGDAAELVELVREHQPELAVVDIRMPPTNSTEGLDAARAIREELPQIAIMVLSAHAEVEHATELLVARGSVTCSRAASRMSTTSSRRSRGSPAAAQSSTRPWYRSSSPRAVPTTRSAN